MPTSSFTAFDTKTDVQIITDDGSYEEDSSLAAIEMAGLGSSTNRNDTSIQMLP